MNKNQTQNFIHQQTTQQAVQKKTPKIPREEIDETYNLLKDFGIFIKRSDIPCNVTIFDLHLWRKDKIKAYLQS